MSGGLQMPPGDVAAHNARVAALIVMLDVVKVNLDRAAVGMTARTIAIGVALGHMAWMRDWFGVVLTLAAFFGYVAYRAIRNPPR